MKTKQYNFKTPYELINPIILQTVYILSHHFRLMRFTNGNIILCYHSIGNGNWRFTTPIELFEQQILYLKANFTITSLDELLASPNTRGKIAITFDDGYQDFLTNAHPILKKYDIPATIFAIGLPKEANRIELDNDLPLLTHAQLKAIHSLGYSIGFHTSRHNDIMALTSELLEEEIIIGKDKLEKKLGFPIQYFAYPRGAISDLIVSSVTKANFKYAFTANNDIVSYNDLNKISRKPLEGKASMIEFIASLSGLGITIEKTLFKLLSFKETIARKYV